jgi:hypothetical protein
MRSLMTMLAMGCLAAAPALAQQNANQDAPTNASPGSEATGSMQGMEALRQARERLREAALEFRNASQAKNQAQTEQAARQVEQATADVRQAISQLTPQQRAEVQERLRQAQQGMQVQDQRAQLEALDGLLVAAEQGGDQAHAITEQQVREKLGQVGFESVKVLESSFVAQATTQAGDRVVIFVNPHLGLGATAQDGGNPG